MELFHASRRCHIMLQTFMVLLVLCRSGVFAGNGTMACKLLYETQLERKVLDRLEPLVNKNFTFNITDEEGSYTYVFQLCGDAGGVPQAGAILVNNKDKKTTKIGLYTSTKAIGGSNWVMLIYRGGDKYHSHCNRQNRTALIMISCNKNVEMGNFKVISENRERGTDCFYLFELDSSTVCPADQ